MPVLLERAFGALLVDAEPVLEDAAASGRAPRARRAPPCRAPCTSAAAPRRSPRARRAPSRAPGRPRTRCGSPGRPLAGIDRRAFAHQRPSLSSDSTGTRSRSIGRVTGWRARNAGDATTRYFSRKRRVAWIDRVGVRTAVHRQSISSRSSRVRQVVLEAEVHVQPRASCRAAAAACAPAPLVPNSTVAPTMTTCVSPGDAGAPAPARPGRRSRNTRSAHLPHVLAVVGQQRTAGAASRPGAGRPRPRASESRG